MFGIVVKKLIFYFYFAIHIDEVTQDSMQEKFKECGKIEYIRIVDTNRGRDAYVCFKEPKSVDLAMEPFK